MSEPLPRFEGIETPLLGGPRTARLPSEPLPRFEGIETEKVYRDFIGTDLSEPLPRFEGIETWRGAWLLFHQAWVRTIAPL